MFDETLIEKSFEDTLLGESPISYNFKYLSNQFGCVFLQDEDALPYDDADVGEMIRCMKV